jgi:hypothetical protein
MTTSRLRDPEKDQREFFDRVRNAKDFTEFHGLLTSCYATVLTEIYGPEVLAVSQNDDIIVAYVESGQADLQRTAFDCMRFLRYVHDERILKMAEEYISAGPCDDIKRRCIYYIIQLGDRDGRAVDILTRCSDSVRRAKGSQGDDSLLWTIDYAVRLLRWAATKGTAEK